MGYEVTTSLVYGIQFNFGTDLSRYGMNDEDYKCDCYCHDEEYDEEEYSHLCDCECDEEGNDLGETARYNKLQAYLQDKGLVIELNHDGEGDDIFDSLTIGISIESGTTLEELQEADKKFHEVMTPDVYKTILEILDEEPDKVKPGVYELYDKTW